MAALPLTDSLSKAHNVTIKRTTDRWRQHKNKPTAYELEVINKYKKQLALNEALKPAIHTVEQQSIFYAPIITQGLCLKCHGEKEAILDYLSIQEKYPNDLAVGYKPGDLRGIWSIAFEK